MMKKFSIQSFKKIIITICLCSIAGYCFINSAQRKTLLILHSYGPDYAWVRDVNLGIKRVIQGKSQYNILWHYMDTKNHPGKEYKTRAGIIARRVVDYVKPDVVLSVDDDAQAHVMKYYVNNKDIQIVFSGVNATPAEYGYDKANNATGMLERWPYEAIKAAVITQGDRLQLPKPYRIIHISDQSHIVRFDDANAHAYKNWAPLEFMPSILVATFDEWKAMILASKNLADFILISNYRQVYKDKSKTEIIPFKDVITWTFKNAPIPIIAVNGFVCEEGAAISVAASPFEQGELGAKMALAVLEGKKTSEIPIQQSYSPMILMSEERLKIAGMKFPQIYEAFARATNNYFSDSSSKPAA